MELVNLTNFEVLHSWNPDLDKFNGLAGVDEYKYLDRQKTQGTFDSSKTYRR